MHASETEEPTLLSEQSRPLRSLNRNSCSTVRRHAQSTCPCPRRVVLVRTGRRALKRCGDVARSSRRDLGRLTERSKFAVHRTIASGGSWARATTSCSAEGQILVDSARQNLKVVASLENSERPSQHLLRASSESRVLGAALPNALTEENEAHASVPVQPQAAASTTVRAEQLWFGGARAHRLGTVSRRISAPGSRNAKTQNTFVWETTADSCPTISKAPQRYARACSHMPPDPTVCDRGRENGVVATARRVAQNLAQMAQHAHYAVRVATLTCANDY